VVKVGHKSKQSHGPVDLDVSMAKFVGIFAQSTPNSRVKTKLRRI